MTFKSIGSIIKKNNKAAKLIIPSKKDKKQPKLISKKCKHPKEKHKL